MKKAICVLSAFLLLGGCAAGRSANSSVVNDVAEFHKSEIVRFKPTIASLKSTPAGFERTVGLCRNETIMKKVVIPVSKELAAEILSQGKGAGMALLFATTVPDQACLSMFDGVEPEKALEIYNRLLADRSILKAAVYQWAEDFNRWQEAKDSE